MSERGGDWERAATLVSVRVARLKISVGLFEILYRFLRSRQKKEKKVVSIATWSNSRFTGDFYYDAAWRALWLRRRLLYQLELKEFIFCFFILARMRDSSRQHAVNLHIGPKRETRFAFWGHPATKRSCRRRQAAQGGAGYVVFVIIQTEDREEFSETGKIT